MVGSRIGHFAGSRIGRVCRTNPNICANLCPRDKNHAADAAAGSGHIDADSDGNLGSLGNGHGQTDSCSEFDLGTNGSADCGCLAHATACAHLGADDAPDCDYGPERLV